MTTTMVSVELNKVIQTGSRPLPRGHRWVAQTLAGAVLAQALAWPTALCAQSLPAPVSNLPALGDTASASLSLNAEAKLGQQIMRSIRRDPDYLDDPVLLEYVQSLWQPLLAASRQQGQLEGDVEQRLAWEPFLVRDRSVNAFALPGGYVGVHLGLIALADTRDELAAVLAHEMTHVTQRHIARSLDSGKQQALMSMAAMIMGVLVASRSNDAGGGAANALMVGGQAGAVQAGLNFSRDMEREADRVGFSVLTGAGFEPSGMASMFERLEQSSRLNDGGGFPYLRTHPLNAARIGEAKARLGVGPAASTSGSGRGEHLLAQARARVLMDFGAAALRRWQAQDLGQVDRASGDSTQKLGTAYSVALASTLLQDWPRADAALKKAQDLMRADTRAGQRVARLLALLQAQSLLARGDALAAWSVLQPEAAQWGRPGLVLSSQVVVALLAPRAGSKAQSVGEPLAQRLAQDLQSSLSNSSGDAGLWLALSRVQSALNQRLRSARSDAESHYALGDWDGASDRLRAAQRLARSDPADFIELSVIDTRLRQIDAQRRELALETRRP